MRWGEPLSGGARGPMPDIPANLIKLSVKVMVTSMETITRNMQEIQEQTANASA